MLGFGRRAYARRPRVQIRAPFNPTDYSGCTFFLHAGRGITIATGVSNWVDQTGNLNTYVQATPANQLGYAPRGDNPGTGPAVTFSGSQWMTNSAHVLNNNNVSLFLVLKASTTAANILAASFGTSTGNLGGWAPELLTPNRNVHVNSVADMTDGAATTNWEVWSIFSDGSNNWTFFVNGAAKSLTNNTSVPAAQNAISVIGALNSNGTAAWQGSMSRIIGFNRKVSTLEQIQIENALLAEAGIVHG